MSLRKGALVCVTLLIPAFGAAGYAATINATDLSASSVQAAINSASAGDTVVIPAGAGTWTTKVTCSKAITILGAGIDATIITRNTAIGDGALEVTCPASGVFTLSGITWQTIPSSQWGIVKLAGTYGVLQPQYRITNCKFVVAPTNYTVGTHALTILNVYGVVDHCTFINTSANGQSITLEGTNQTDLQNNWNIPQSLGDEYANVVEDCTFTNVALADGALDAYDGQKLVFRYNTVTNTNVGWHGADSNARSPRSFEVYKNTFSATVGVYTVVRARGGTGVIWGNTITGTYNSFAVFSVYCADPTYSRNTWGYATGSNPVDGNQNVSGYSPPYPVLDQVGRGSFPAGTPWPKQCTAAQYEQLDPVYAWGNSYDGNTSPTITVGNPSQSTGFLHQGVDYYDNTPKPGYAPLTYPHPLATAAVTPPSNAKTTITVQ